MSVLKKRKPNNDSQANDSPNLSHTELPTTPRLSNPVNARSDVDIVGTNNSSMTYTPSQVTYESSSQLNTTTPLKKKMKIFMTPPSSSSLSTPEEKNIKGDIHSTSSTPSKSSDFSCPSVIHKMMKKMNYDGTLGLGVDPKAPTKIIEESKQKGRRGLGFEYKNFKEAASEWDFSRDPAPIIEFVQWCTYSDHQEISLDLDEMRQWIEIGRKKKTIDDEIEFCDETILKDMLDGKSVFDELPAKEMEEARARSNVYETIGKSIFQNRAAVKMANIDSVFERMFSIPKSADDQQSLVRHNEPFYFADICAGPGGFSEYILWRKGWRAKGFGFTLKGKDDFKLHNFIVGPPETFDPHYGVRGTDGDGDIFKSENIDAFQAYVHKCTNNSGVHIVMADGGFSVEGQENIQEILSKQLYLCQFLTALSILRPDGHFVCKLFDLFTPFSVGLVYLMYRTFHKISIHKPVTSRPANSERYIICKSLRGNIRDIVRAYMSEINTLLNKYKKDSEIDDVISIVPMDIIKRDKMFYEYIRRSNNEMGEIQIRNLRKIRAFASNSKLNDDRQSEIRTKCLERWELPDEPRQRSQRLERTDVQNTLLQQLGYDIQNLLLNMPNPLKRSVLDQHRIQSLFDYRCVLSLGNPVLMISCGRQKVFYCELKDHSKSWNPLNKTRFGIELPHHTLLLAELVMEQYDDGKNTRSRPAVYIVDAYFISNENMLLQSGRQTVFMDRHPLLKLFERTINKPVRTDLVPIRISQQLRLEQMDDQFLKLSRSQSMDHIDTERLIFVHTEHERRPYVPVCGLWIFKFLQYPWTMLLSRSQQTKYFHNQLDRSSIQTAPSDSSHVAPLKSMLENSFYWDFDSRDDPVQKSYFVSFIQNKNRELQSANRPNNTK